MDDSKFKIDALLDIGDLQRIFKIGRSTAWQWVRDKRLPAPIKIGGATRWKAEQIKEFLNGL